MRTAVGLLSEGPTLAERQRSGGHGALYWHNAGMALLHHYTARRRIVRLLMQGFDSQCYLQTFSSTA